MNYWKKFIRDSCHEGHLISHDPIENSATTRTGPLGKRVTAPFNNMRALKFKAQPTNAFFATANQMFGGSSQLPTTAKHCSVV